MAITKREIASFVIGGFVAAAVFFSYSRHTERPTEVVHLEPLDCTFASVISGAGGSRNFIEVNFIRECQAKIKGEVANTPKDGQTTVTYVFGIQRGRGWFEVIAIYENGNLVEPVKLGESVEVF